METWRTNSGIAGRLNQRASKRERRVHRLATSTEANKPSRVAGLDLLRGVAVALVIVQHGLRTGVSGPGVVGVVIFFTLSGYLITGLLLRDMVMYERIRFCRFYVARVLRLYPPLICLLAFYIVFESYSTWGSDKTVGSSAIVGITYTSDLPFFTQYVYAHGIGNLWSLAVEEQFYLLWPALIMLVSRTSNLRRFALVAIAIAEIAALTGPLLGQPPRVIYYYPTSWAVALVIGSAAAIYQDKLCLFLTRARLHRILIVIATIVLLFWCLKGSLSSASYTYWLGAPTMAIATVMYIFWLREWDSIPTRWLNPLWGLGVVSYAAYLWNLLVSSVVLDRRISDAAGFVLSFAITIFAAVTSWYVVERPIRNMRKRYESYRLVSARHGSSPSDQKSRVT